MVIWWMIVAGLGQSVIGLLQGFGVLKSFHSEFALTGTFGNPGPFGGYLSVVIALLFSYVLSFGKAYHEVRRIRVVCNGIPGSGHASVWLSS